MAERVVHALQAVDVEQEQRERVAVALLEPEQVVDLLAEVAQVEEAGERVCVREPLELARARPAAGPRPSPPWTTANSWIEALDRLDERVPGRPPAAPSRRSAGRSRAPRRPAAAQASGRRRRATTRAPRSADAARCRGDRGPGASSGTSTARRISSISGGTSRAIRSVGSSRIRSSGVCSISRTIQSFVSSSADADSGRSGSAGSRRRKGGRDNARTPRRHARPSRSGG